MLCKLLVSFSFNKLRMRVIPSELTQPENVKYLILGHSKRTQTPKALGKVYDLEYKVRMREQNFLVFELT